MIPEEGTTSELKAAVFLNCQVPPVAGEVYMVSINPQLFLALPMTGLVQGLKWRVFSVSPYAVMICCVTQSRYLHRKESFTPGEWELAATKGMIKFIGYDP